MFKLQDLQTWLIDHQAQMEAELEELCNINSGSDSIEGLRNAATWLVDYFAPIDATFAKRELRGFETIDDRGRRCLNSTGAALRWDLSSNGEKTQKRVLLNIHYDTVYGTESPFQRCERYETIDRQGNTDRKMRGPGVIDAKGGIIVLRWAVLAAQRYLDLSHTGLTILLTPDEEIGSPASSELWNEIAHEFDFAMLFEPTLADGSMVSHRKGTGTFTIVARGKSAHAGRNFLDGRNAIVLASKIAVAIDSLNHERSNVTLNVGRIRGGDAVNVVPDLAVLRVNVRVACHEDSDWVLSHVQQIVREFNNLESGFTTELHGGIGSAPKPIDSQTQHWMRIVEKAAENLGESVQWKLSGGASDGNKLAALGLSNIDTFGPEGDLLHSDQEWVRLSSLPRKAALAASMIELFSHPRSQS
jgi:glutamate carboxypeptidase